MNIPNKHSGTGIASFIIAVVSILGMIMTVAIARGGMLEGVRSYLFLAGIMFIFIIASLIGAVLGISGLVQRDRLKLFPVLGLTLNTVIVALFLIILFGSAMFGPALPDTLPVSPGSPG